MNFGLICSLSLTEARYTMWGVQQLTGDESMYLPK